MADVTSRLPTQDAADGTDGSTIPSATLAVGGIDGSGNLQTLAVDTTGRISASGVLEGVSALTDTTNINGSASRTSAAIDMQNYGTAIVSVYASHAGSFTIEWSYSGSGSWRSDVDVYDVSAAVLKTATYGPKRRYMRVVYTNGSTTTTTFELTVDLKTAHTKPSSHKASETFNDSTDLEGVKAVISGKRNDATYGNATLTNGNNLKVSLQEVDVAIQESGLLGVAAIGNGGGTQAALTVGTSAVELKVGGSALTNRVNATCYNNSLVTIYWGYTSGVTTSSGTPISPTQMMTWDAGASTTIYLIAGTSNNNTRITELAGT